ncbi:MAG: biotin/lipoyl-binding protein [Mariniphaga sp.]|nr:biotin/lipoyl-binding protein [Mariniphaga sp.]
MALDIKLNNRTATVEIISQQGNILEIKVDEKTYKIDLMHTADGTFSIIENGHSYDIELIATDHPKRYTAHTLYNMFDLEIVDAESQYLLNRGASGIGNSENSISSPMPGKVVKIMVSEGDNIKEGDTAIIISAMKMESEYKSPKDGVVKKIHIKEGDTIEGNQVLIELE